MRVQEVELVRKDEDKRCDAKADETGTEESTHRHPLPPQHRLEHVAELLADVAGIEREHALSSLQNLVKDTEKATLCIMTEMHSPVAVTAAVIKVLCKVMCLIEKSATRIKDSDGSKRKKLALSICKCVIREGFHRRGYEYSDKKNVLQNVIESVAGDIINDVSSASKILNVGKLGAEFIASTCCDIHLGRSGDVDSELMSEKKGILKSIIRFFTCAK